MKKTIYFKINEYTCSFFFIKEKFNIKDMIVDPFSITAMKYDINFVLF